MATGYSAHLGGPPRTRPGAPGYSGTGTETALNFLSCDGKRLAKKRKALNARLRALRRQGGNAMVAFLVRHLRV